MTTQREQTAVEPACPVCNHPPEFTLDRRNGEWSGQCKRCSIEGSRASTEQEARRKWVEWHHVKAQAAVEPVATVTERLIWNGSYVIDATVFLKTGAKLYTTPPSTQAAMRAALDAMMNHGAAYPGHLTETEYEASIAQLRAQLGEQG